MINELIEQIGGRDRLEAFSAGHYCSVFECRNMARALLEVLNAKPFAYIHPQMLSDLNEGARVCGCVWSNDIDELSHEKRLPLYTDTPAASVPDGWKLVPLEPHWSMIDAAIKHHEGEAFLPVSLYKAMLAAAPAPGGDGG